MLVQITAEVHNTHSTECIANNTRHFKILYKVRDDRGHHFTGEEVYFCTRCTHDRIFDNNSIGRTCNLSASALWRAVVPKLGNLRGNFIAVRENGVELTDVQCTFYNRLIVIETGCP